MAAWQAAWGTGALDWGAQEIALCERFHCLPSALQREDLGELLRNVALLDTYRLGLKAKSGQTLTEDENIQVGELLMSEVER